LEIQPYEADEAAYHRLAGLGQRVVLALLMNAVVDLAATLYCPLRPERVAGVTRKPTRRNRRGQRRS